MLTKNERMNALSAAGINTSKYFTVDLDNGTKIHLIIDENGNPVRVDNTENDPILNGIIEDGYVRNSKLHRRFVMAQMFAALNYVSYDGEYSGYNECIKRRYGYKYTIDMMTEEVRVLSKLEERDRETFEEREHFFNKITVVAVLEDYIKKLKAYVEKLPNKNCKGVPYKRVKGTNIFVADLQKKVYSPIERYIGRVERAKNYKEIYRILCEFKRNMIALPYNTPKSKAWIDAYKGSGAYYTMRNLCCFHSCKIYKDDNVYEGTSAVKYLNSLLGVYEGWRFFALMKKVIADNEFDFNKRMREIYHE